MTLNKWPLSRVSFVLEIEHDKVKEYRLIILPVVRIILDKEGVVGRGSPRWSSIGLKTGSSETLDD